MYNNYFNIFMASFWLFFTFFFANSYDYWFQNNAKIITKITS